MENNRYHRLATTTTVGRTLLLPLTAALFYAAFLIVGGIGIAIMAITDSAKFELIDAALSDPEMLFNSPEGLVVGLGFVALMLPAALLAARVTGRPGMLHSVAGRLRWRLLLEAVVPAALLYVVAYTLFALATGSSLNPIPNAGLLAVIALVLVPLQAAGEEYVFRGIIPQTVGRFLRAPIWGVIVAVPLFLVGHENNALGLISIAVFAIGAAYLVWRTGGLEVALAWHTVNNLVAFITTFLGVADPAAPVTATVMVVDIALSLVTIAAFELAWRRRWSQRYDAAAPAVAKRSIRPEGNGMAVVSVEEVLSAAGQPGA